VRTLSRTARFTRRRLVESPFFPRDVTLDKYTFFSVIVPRANTDRRKNYDIGLLREDGAGMDLDNIGVPLRTEA